MNVQTRVTAPGLAGLVQESRVHRSVYVDPAIFEAEMTHLFGRAWLYVAHESQIASPGSYVTAQMGRQPVDRKSVV